MHVLTIIGYDTAENERPKDTYLPLAPIKAALYTLAQRRKCPSSDRRCSRPSRTSLDALYRLEEREAPLALLSWFLFLPPA